MSTTQEIRQAARSLRHTPVFTVTAALTLTIGIAATIAMFAVVNGVLLRPLPYGHPDRLVGAWHDLPPLSLMHAQQTSGTYHTYQKLAHTIEGIGLYNESAVNVAQPGDAAPPERLSAAYMTAGVIPILEVSPLLGRDFSEAEDLPNGPPVMLISEGLWRTQFGGDQRIVGRAMEVNGVSRQIVGVMRRQFRFPTAGTQIWLPLALDPNDPYPGGFNYNGVARLKPGVSIQEAERDFAAVLPRMVEIAPLVAPGVSTQLLLDQAKPTPVLVPMLADTTSGVSGTLWTMAAAAALVLLVAIANVANLVLVRADSRQRELAVREALGAGRARVLSLFLAESAVLAFAATTAGLAIAWASVRTLVRMGPAGIPRLAELRVDGLTIAFALVVAVFVVVVCSLIPALRIGRVPLSHALREGGRGGTAGRTQHRVRGALAAAQIALALVVLSGSGLLLRTFTRLNAVRPGFDAGHVATFWMSLARARYADEASIVHFYSRLTARVAALPGVRNVGLTSRLPLASHGLSQDPFYPEDDPSFATKIPPLQLYTTVDSGYFRAMGIPVIAGRVFDQIERQRAGEAIISQATAAQFWHDSSGVRALGKRFRELPNRGPWYTVIGVVGNARDTALAAPPSQTVYLPEVIATDSTWRGFDHTERTMALVVRTDGDPAAVIPGVQRLVREMDPTLPTFDVRTMPAVLSASMAQLSFTIIILGAAAAVTLILGAVGLYGVMAYLVRLRTRELGVRMALGARPAAVVAMLTRQGLGITAIGVGAGLVLFMIVARLLRTFLYGVAPNDPLTLVAASLVLVLTAALASWIPARRASRVDPADTLRAE